jgi:transketolase
MDAHHASCVNTIKGLAMDAVQAANSGHPGMPMGAADMATVLWRSFLKHDPSQPLWPDRDRFILSAGHGSMLLYSLLHLAGYDLPLSEIKDFRQWGSKTPGHPEVGHTAGVEMTTGPLGQGFATGVGMAMAERLMREEFGEDLCDHWTYAIVSDGDLMEGVASEAASLAGHLKLSRLVYLYDDNEISIDGGTDISFTEDRAKRFESYGWHVQAVDGHDADAIHGAIAAAKSDDRPSLICCRTIIGHGCDIEGTSKTHGAPLGAERIAATKVGMGWDPQQHFAVPEGVPNAFRGHDGAARRATWEARVAEHPRGAELRSWLARDTDALIANTDWPDFAVGTKLATRKASAAVLKALTAKAPWLIGGSADLSGSNGVNIGAEHVSATKFAGAQSIHFGVREHAMGAICNGMVLHGGVLAYGATFLMFHDYMRPAVRLAGLMKVPSITIYTHDSIFLGEDGPTHQPISTLLALRAIPGCMVLRPADANETSECWKLALSHKEGPVALVLTRQGLPIHAPTDVAGASRGGYVLSDCDGDPSVVLLGTGSEVETCMDAQKLLAADGVAARVVSLPCRELFWAQDPTYRSSVLGNAPRLSVEAGVTLGWERYVGDTGAMVGIDTYGASAPASVLAEKFGFTAANVAAQAKKLF